jgi:hypothetical protein
VLQSAQDNMEALQAYREQTQALFDSAAAEAEAAAGALGSQSGG